ncbi:MAG: two component transcriptional regulator, winged helix family [Chloroflexi bacterium]|jgi:two-component system KDP operon response regulator KdpE|nr:two component transcriptional regulator, winged helix family [Chloroflexota bacterium]
MSFTILIAEDEPSIATIVSVGARMTWPDCRVLVATTGTQALQMFQETMPDLVVLDVQMPPPDGFTVCQRIRETSRVPVMILTVRDSTLDKVRALDLGADDYLTKPFDHLELLARLRALVRRAQGSAMQNSRQLHIDGVTLDPVMHAVTVAGSPVTLTTTEFRLLEVLMRHAGTALPVAYLLREVWGSAYVGQVEYVRVFIGRLRQKLGDDAEQQRYIQTVWNSGYRFVPMVEQHTARA